MARAFSFTIWHRYGIIVAGHDLPLGGGSDVPVVDGDVAGERVLGLAVLAAQPAGVAHAREVLRLLVQGGRQNSISCFKRISLKIWFLREYF